MFVRFRAAAGGNEDTPDAAPDTAGLALDPEQTLRQSLPSSVTEAAMAAYRANKGVVTGVGASQVTAWLPSSGDRTFRFDAVLQGVTQQRMYDRTARALTDDVLAGFNATLLCYGQAGAGKTYTVFGSLGAGAGGEASEATVATRGRTMI